MKVDETVLLVPVDGQVSEHMVESEIDSPLISDAFESRTLGLARFDESGWLKSVAETGWAEAHEEVRADASEEDKEERDEVSDETILLVSEDEQGIEHILEFETAESETVGSVVFKTSMM